MKKLLITINLTVMLFVGMYALGDVTTSIPQISTNRVRRSHVNDPRSTQYQDVGPRNSVGTPVDLAGSLGTAAIRWLKARIASGYWNAGDIKYHHDNGGATPVSQGWFKMDGTTIGEAAYEAQAGRSVGDWDTFIISSPLNGVATVDMDNRYIVGEGTVSEHGDSAGNASHQIAINHAHSGGTHTHTMSSHTHTGPSHVHKVYDFIALNMTGQIFDGVGASIDISFDTATSGDHLRAGQGANAVDVDLNTGTGGTAATGANNDATANNTGNTTGSALSGTQSIQPSSFKMGVYIRIID